MPIIIAFEAKNERTSVNEETAWLIMSIRKKPGEIGEILTIIEGERQRSQVDLLPHLELCRAKILKP